jgi:alkyl hydroperoxide reductase subunit AhpF
MAKAKKEVSQDVIDKVGGVEYLQRAFIKDEIKNIELEVIVSVPDRTSLGEYMKYASVNPKKAQEILVKNCLHTDVEAVMASRHLFMGAFAAIVELLPISEVRLGKY